MTFEEIENIRKLKTRLIGPSNNKPQSNFEKKATYLDQTLQKMNKLGFLNKVDSLSFAKASFFNKAMSGSLHPPKIHHV